MFPAPFSLCFPSGSLILYMLVCLVGFFWGSVHFYFLSFLRKNTLPPKISTVFKSSCRLKFLQTLFQIKSFSFSRACEFSLFIHGLFPGPSLWPTAPELDVGPFFRVTPLIYEPVLGWASNLWSLPVEPLPSMWAGARSIDAPIFLACYVYNGAPALWVGWGGRREPPTS